MLLAMAFACAAFALVLWQRAARGQRRGSVERFVERRVVASGIGAMNGPSTSGRAQGSRPGPAPSRAGKAGPSSAPGERSRQEGAARFAQALEHLGVRAGLSSAGKPLLFTSLAVVLGVVWIGMRTSVVAACAAAVASAAAVALVVTARAQRRRLAIVTQLPAFLDGIVRLVTLGNSVPAAFQAALQTTEAPLRECLDHVSRMMRAGVEIDRALAHVAIVYRAREFEFVGAVLRLSVKYGGRADVMLERMSAFMRDLEQAERELSAMSAETRLSAWVLVALPLLIGGFLIATNPAYFQAMWGDATGRRLICLAFGLQAVGGYLLYRMTRLRA
ncbi:type II secretion system F family protein [Trinickia sp. NRRL B-1857]